MNTGIKTRGGKEIRLGDIVRPCKRPSSLLSSDIGKTWRVELRKFPFVLVDTCTNKPYQILEPWLDGELAIVGHLQEDNQ